MGTFLVMIVQVMNIINRQRKWVSGQKADASNCKQKAKGPIRDIHFRKPDSLAETGYTSMGKCRSIAMFMSKDASITKMTNNIKYRYDSVFVFFAGDCYNKFRCEIEIKQNRILVQTSLILSYFSIRDEKCLRLAKQV